jgi:hypothetical protein
MAIGWTNKRGKQRMWEKVKGAEVYMRFPLKILTGITLVLK